MAHPRLTVDVRGFRMSGAVCDNGAVRADARVHCSPVPVREQEVYWV